MNFKTYVERYKETDGTLFYHTDEFHAGSLTSHEVEVELRKVWDAAFAAGIEHEIERRNSDTDPEYN